jgi:hypothetical protein
MCHDLQARLGSHDLQARLGKDKKSLSLSLSFFFCAKGKRALKGERFNITIIQARSLDISAKTQTMHFKKCFEQWYDHWALCGRSPRYLDWKGTTPIRRYILLERNRFNSETI